MSFPIIPTKRIINSHEPTPKRVRREDPHPLLHLFEQCPRLEKHLSIRDIGFLAETCKEAKHCTDLFYLRKVEKMGYSVQTAEEAKQKLRQIYQYFDDNDGNFDPKSFYCKFAKMSRNDLLSLSCWPAIYTTSAGQHLLEALESKRTWKKALREPEEDTDGSREHSYEALSYALYFKCSKLVERLLEAKVTPAFEDWLPNPEDTCCALPQLLHTAILVRDYNTVRYLLDHGTDIHHELDLERDPDLEKPELEILQYALGSKEVRQHFPEARFDLKMLQLLLESGAEVTEAALCDAAEACSWDAIELLRTHGGSWDKESAELALFQLVTSQLSLSPTKVNEEAKKIIPFLLDAGADVNALDNRNNTLLHDAIDKYSLEWVKYLTELGASTAICGDYGLTPLMQAIKYGSLDIVRQLVEAGADVNQLSQQYGKFNALTYACSTVNDPLNSPPKSNSPEIVEFLLEKGAQPMHNVYNPLNCAYANHLHEIAYILEKHGIEEDSESN